MFHKTNRTIRTTQYSDSAFPNTTHSHKNEYYILRRLVANGSDEWPNEHREPYCIRAPPLKLCPVCPHFMCEDSMTQLSIECNITVVCLDRLHATSTGTLASKINHCFS